MKQQQDNLNVIQAVCNQLENEGFKPSGIVLAYGHIPDKYKYEKDGFNDDDIVSLIMDNEKPIIKLYES